jgi:mono/diheme cytochrome c family protein
MLVIEALKVRWPMKNFQRLVFFTLLSPLVANASAAEKDMTDKGQALVEKNCAHCHAIGKEGDSPHKEAPPFRTLSAKYPVSDLAESLAEGIVSGHPDMPIFVFDPQDVAAIIDYLESIQLSPQP